jgi:hypothetical protein
VHIFSVFPPASIPQFTLLAPVLVLPLFNDDFPGILGTTSRHVIIATAFTTVLWDFIDDAWVSWPRDPTEFDDVRGIRVPFSPISLPNRPSTCAMTIL